MNTFKRILFLIILLNTFSTLPAQKVILQGFWWDYHNNNYHNGWANYLTELAPRLKALGIDAVWIPPSIKNGNQGVGYSPFDHYDLGDKFQKGFTKTRLGDKDELLRLVAVLHANGIEVVQDLVLNHADNAGSSTGDGGQDPSAWDDFTTSRYKNFRYVSYTTPAMNASANNYLSRSGRFPKNWQNFYPNPGNNSTTGDWNSVYWGPDIAYDQGSYGQSSNAIFNPTQQQNYMRNNMRKWLIWYKKQIGFDGVRIDAVKHFPDWATEDFLANMQFNSDWANGGNDMIAVGEFVGGKAQLDNWTSAVQNRAGTFDFSLRDGIYSMISSNGNFNIGSIPSYQQNNRVFYFNDINKYIHRTVPFVNNHDTYRPNLDNNGDIIGWNTSSELAPHINPQDGRLSAAYAIILSLDGTPQIFFEDLFNIFNSNRWTHDPKNPSQLPINSDLENIIWCHQNLDFKNGAYKVRHQSEDHLIIERSTKALIGINDNWDTWQNTVIQTDFAPGTVLADYSGSNGINTITVDPQGNATINTPPCNGTANQGRRGYSIWAPQGINTTYNNTAIKTTQEWEMANDLGDSHPNSLQQGGALPSADLSKRYVGKVYVDSGKVFTYDIYPSVSNEEITIAMYNGSTKIYERSELGHFSESFTPNFSGWIAIEANNTSMINNGQNFNVKVQYYAPKNVLTSSSGIVPNASVSNLLVTSNEFDSEAPITVYPNPSNGIFHMLNTSSVHLIEITDLLGKKLDVISGKNVKTLDIQHLPKGIYTIKFHSHTGIQTQKIFYK